MSNPRDRGAFWGVDIGGTTIVIGFLENGFRRVATMDMDIRESPERTLERLSEAMEGTGTPAGAVGVGIAGLVDAGRGILVSSPNLPEWRDYNVRERLSLLLRCPVIVDNDCNVFAIGALSRGLIPGSGLWLMVTLGTGIGGTIILDGRIVYGTGFAGEFGHMTVEAYGRECPCGSRGCWERYAAAGALSRYYSEFGGEEGTRPVVIAERAAAGDVNASSAFTRFGEWLGIGLANLYHCLNPEGVFLAGGLSGSADLFLPSARKEFSSRCGYEWNVMQLPASSTAGAEGAALMAVRRFDGAEEGA
ncbi:MAG: hypothetical protein AVO35_10475 [Candidatus Aegiribacteria sp. MLS_C]|nr:MAG: hypothetical protein AVO35_10475 [Candidatus Aegiribacteria sp. MLS_C]